jgi:O-antigen/teichoic acid export membrane protein
MNSSVENGGGPAAAHTGRFLRNVAWNWLGVVLNIVSALILSPYIIRKLGDDNFGLWALTLSLVEYYWLLDFGLRSATIRYSAHHHATGEHKQINTIINTALGYSLCVAPPLIGGTLLVSPWLASLFHITHPLFSRLLAVVVISWALVGALNVFASCLEGFQRFDLTNQCTIAALTVRTTLAFLLLRAGYGVVELAYVTFGSQVLLHTLCYFRLRSVFPKLRISLREGRLSMLRTMLSYGVHSVVASLGQRILSNAPQLIIGYLLPTRFVGYYSAPVRLLDYTVEAILRIGNVSNPHAASLMAAGRSEDTLRLGVYVNRYCLLLFLPISLFLAFYGSPVLSVWINPQFGGQAAGVLVPLLIGMTIANVGMYNSGSILFGMGRHQVYSRLLLLEALACVTGIFLVVPRYGIVGAAWTASLLMLVNRGPVTAWLLTSELKAGYWSFLGKVYAPLILAAPMSVVLYVLRLMLPGKNWGQLILAGGLLMMVYLPVALLLLERSHRDYLFRFLRLSRA